MAAHLLSGIVVGSHHSQVMDSDSWLLHITIAFFFLLSRTKGQKTLLFLNTLIQACYISTLYV